MTTIRPSSTSSLDMTGLTAEKIETGSLHSTAMTLVSEEEPVKKRSSLRMVAIMTALCLSLFIAALDQSILATAVPTIASEFGSPIGYVWIMSAYLLASSAAGPIWAKLSDIWGRKPIILTAVMLFLCSSVICALAPSMLVLIVGRILQGVAGGGLMVMVNITISDLLSVRRRSLYLGLLEVMWTLAGGSAPILGGTFTQLLSWRWCFWINVPISLTAFTLLFLFLDVHNPKTPLLEGLKAIDWLGSISILGFTVMLFLGLQLGGATFAWDSWQVITLIAVGVLMLVLFWYCEAKLAKHPLIPMDLLTSWTNVSSLLVCFFHGMTFIAMEYYLPLYLQSALLSSPLKSGLLTIPITLTEALTGIVCGVLIHQSGKYLPIIYTGTLLMTVGNGLYILFNRNTSLGMIVGIEILAGIGSGCLFQPALIALQAGVSQSNTATATSTFFFVRNIATSLSLVIGAVVFQNSMNTKLPTLLSEGLSSNVTSLLENGQAAANVLAISMIEDQGQREAVQDAYSGSLRNLWCLYVGIAFLAFLSSLGIARKVLATEHVETKTGLHKEVDFDSKTLRSQASRETIISDDKEMVLDLEKNSIYEHDEKTLRSSPSVESFEDVCEREKAEFACALRDGVIF